MATPNIVPQQTNDGNLGRHGLRWAGIAAHILSSPVIKIVKDTEADVEGALELSVDANGSLVLTNDGVAVTTATSTDISQLSTMLTTLAGTDDVHPSVTSIVAALGNFKALATKVGTGALPDGYTDLIDAVTKLKAQIGQGGVDFTNIASPVIPDQDILVI